MALKMFRDNLKSLAWVLWLVVVIFIGSIFFDWGGVNRAQGSRPDVAATVGDEVVTYRELKSTHDNLERFYKDNYGLDKERLEQFNLPMQALNQLITSKILLLEARRVGIEVTDDELQDAILETYGAFKDEKGRFVGQKEYLRILRQLRIAPAEFEADMRDQLMRSKLDDVLRETAWVSDAEVEAAYREQVEKAKIRFIELPATEVGEGVTVDSAEVEAYYQEHRTEYERPEQRVVDYLLIDKAKLRQDIEIPDEELRAYYDDHLSDFERKETVRARHILRRTGPDRPDAEVETELRELRRRIEAGEAFEALARELSDDTASAARGGTLDPFGRGEMVPEFEQAAFNAQPGQLVGPIKTMHGYHLIEVLGKTPGGTQPFEQVKVIVRSRILTDKVEEIAETKARDLGQRLAQATAGAEDTFGALAAEEGLEVQTTDPFGKDDIVTGIGRAPTFNDKAFELEVTAISEPVEIPRGWAILRLAESRPSHIPELSVIEEEVRETVLDRKKKDAAVARLQELRAGGERGLDDVAAELGLEIRDSAEFARYGSIAGLGSNSKVIDAALASEVGEIGGPLPSDVGAVLFEVVERQVFDPEKFAEEKEATRAQEENRRVQQLLASLIEQRRRDLEVTYMPQLRDTFKIELPGEEG